MPPAMVHLFDVDEPKNPAHAISGDSELVTDQAASLGIVEGIGPATLQNELGAIAELKHDSRMFSCRALSDNLTGRDTTQAFQPPLFG